MRLHGQEPVRQGLTHEQLCEIVNVPLPLYVELALCQDVIEDSEQVWCFANKIWEGIKPDGSKFVEID